MMSNENNYEKSMIVNVILKPETEDNIIDVLMDEMNKQKSIKSNDYQLEQPVKTSDGAYIQLCYTRKLPGRNKLLEYEKRYLRMNIRKISDREVVIDIRQQSSTDSKNALKFIETISKGDSTLNLRHINLELLNGKNKIEFFDRIAAYTFVWSSTPAADDNENTENKEENGEVNNEEVNTDTNTENTEENEEETNTENNVENSEEEQNPEEAPDQEQTKMIRVIADEVNLRVTPSTEAEVIATVDTDTQLPLIETVTGEDEFTWYKVSYEEAEAYVRSDMAEVVETEEQGTENEDANEEEADVQVEDEVTYSQTIGNVVVTATAAKDVLPGNAEFVVTPIVQETDPDQYAETETKLNEKAEEDGYEIAGFLAYDIYFQDSEGNKIEPVDGSVKVSMHYTEPSVPATVSEISVVSVDEEVNEEKNTNIDVMHFVEDQNGKVQDVVNMTEQGQANVETTTDGEIQKAEFNTESFSVFTITWKRKSGNIEEFNFDKIIHLVRQNDSTYTDLNSSVNATKRLVLETEDTNPVLYMSTITSSGINKEMYQLYESETTYRFIGAYIATTSDRKSTRLNSSHT